MKPSPWVLCPATIILILPFPGRAQEEKTKPPAPESDPAALEFLKEVDKVMFNYPAAGVHSLTIRMKLGGNPLWPPEMKEKMKDASLVYRWQQEPWREAADVLGLPPEMAAQKAVYLQGGLPSMRKLASHSQAEVAKHYVVRMEKDGELTKVVFSAREGGKDFPEFTDWYDKIHKIVKSEQLHPRTGKKVEIAYSVIPFGTRWVISEAEQTGPEGPSVARLEYGRSGELPVLEKFSSSSELMKIDFPIEVELNPKHDPAVFGQ